MPKARFSLRLTLLMGITTGLLLHPVAPLHAADHSTFITLHGSDDRGNDDGGGHGGPTKPEDHGKTEFLGTIQTLPASADLTGTWTVDGRAVLVDMLTLIRTDHGVPAVGGKIEVAGVLLADGSSVQASVIHTEDAEREFEDNVFFGAIQVLPASGMIGTWRIGGLTVQVSAATRIETEAAAPAVGGVVRIEGNSQPDGSIAASEIRVQAIDPTSPAPPMIKVKGTIEKLPATPGAKGNWVVNGVVVTVTDDSVRVSGGRKPKVGRSVVIKGAQQINGSVRAKKVNVPRTTDDLIGG